MTRRGELPAICITPGCTREVDVKKRGLCKPCDVKRWRKENPEAHKRNVDRYQARKRLTLEESSDQWHAEHGEVDGMLKQCGWL